MAIRVVTGPPCAGKSTYVSENRMDKDVVVDYDIIAQALGNTVPHDSKGAIRTCAVSARDLVTDLCVERDFDSWIIRHELDADEHTMFEMAGAEFVEIDPGEDVCLARAEADGRPEDCIDAIRAWYAKHGKDKERNMPAKPQEREYRMMAMPLTVFDDIEESEDGEKRYANRFNSPKYVEGYATTFEDPYVLWESEDGWKYVEVIDRNAFEGADMTDVIFQIDHEGPVLARTSNNLIYLEPTDHGLFTAIDLSRTQRGEWAYEDIQSGNYSQMSWAFTIADEQVDVDELNCVVTTRIKRVKKVYDVSAVSRPADPNTSISARRVIDGAIEARRLLEEQRAEREMERRRREIALRAKAMKLG